MSEGQDNSDLLERVREALDGGLAARRTENPEESSMDIETAQEKYIDVDGYCKLIQESGSIDSSDHAPIDSRSFLPPDQVKLDSEQTPFSVDDFHDRLSSFEIMKWTQKPDIISAFQCARHGWKLTDWDSLACVTCKLLLSVPSQISHFTGNDWALELRKSMEKTGHLTTCPWTKIPSPEDILSIPKGSDLYSYILDAITSFKRMTALPTLQDHYRLIMEKLNLKWMRDLFCPEQSGDSGEKTDEIVDKSSAHQDITLFLILNGWTMAGTCLDDVIKCSLCLRQVPLWLCKSTSVENETLELLSPPPSPVKTATKYLEPTTNHWEWCPWRKALEYMPPTQASIDNSENNLLSTFSSVPKKTVDISDYERLLGYIQGECANTKLEYRKEKSGVQLIDSVSAMMENFVSPSVQRLADKRDEVTTPTTASSDVDQGTETEDSMQNNNNKRRYTEGTESVSSKRLCRDLFSVALNDLNV